MDQKIARILIVDDDLNLLKTMGDILKVKGFEPVLASIGEQALALIEEFPIDVALIDLRLTDMSGLDLLRAMKTRQPQIECILLTGYASQNSAIEAIQVGAYGYFQKPFDMEQVLLSIQRAVEKHCMATQLSQSEAHYRLLADHVTDLVWLLDMNLQTTYNSPSVQKLRGFTQDDPQELALDKNLTPASFQKVTQFLTAEIPKMLALPTYEPARALELEVYRRDGSTFWVENKYSLIRSEQANPLSILVEGRDISERKKTEQALNESYSTLQNILESTDALIFSLNRLYCYTSFNRAHAAKMKQLYDQDIQIGRNILEYMTVDNDRSLAKQNIDRALAGETLVDEAFSGDEARSRLYFEVSHTPITTNTGDVIGVSIFSKDITAHKQMELALQKRLMELETVNQLSNSLRAGKDVNEILHILLTETLKSVNASDGCIVLADLAENKLTLVEYSGWCEALLDLSFQLNEGIVGHVFSTNESFISSDIQNDELVSGQIGALIPIQSSGIFLPIRSESGTIGVLIVSFPLPRVFSENEVHLLTIITQLGANAILRSRLQDQAQAFSIDLQKEIAQKILAQELLASEKELLSTTLMSIADGVIVTDQDGLVLLFNRAAESITGYALSEVFKKPVNHFFKLLYNNNLDLVPDVINYLMDLEKAQKSQLELRSPQIINKTGERILLSGSITMLKSADLEENTVGYVMVFRNINEKQKIEAQNMLSQKMEAIGQLAAGIAHEINTPIQYVGDNIEFFQNAYSKYSETLAAYQKVVEEHVEKPLTQDELEQIAGLVLRNKISFFADEVPNAIQEALDGIERVRKIVLAIREFSHPSDKEKKFADVNHGIETTILISKNTWKYCADLETDLDAGLPKIYCQIDEINQVVLNLIVNAAQAIQEKKEKPAVQKGKIIISTRKREDKVEITIQDSGNGIPPEIRARIFDPFFTTKGIGKGTGQGLSMAHNIIVQKHHGMIGVDSEVGQGTTFTIELPIDHSGLEQP